MKVRWPLLAALLCAVVTSACCGDEVKREVTDPAGRFTATLYERDCGATTTWVTRINLREAGTPFDPEKGLIFTAVGQHMPDIRWNPDGHLEVDCVSCSTRPYGYSRVGIACTAWHKVAIIYRFGRMQHRRPHLDP